MSSHTSHNKGDDPKFHVKRSTTVQDWDPTSTIRTKVPLVNSGPK